MYIYGQTQLYDKWQKPSYTNKITQRSVHLHTHKKRKRKEKHISIYKNKNRERATKSIN